MSKSAGPRSVTGFGDLRAVTPLALPCWLASLTLAFWPPDEEPLLPLAVLLGWSMTLALTALIARIGETDGLQTALAVVGAGLGALLPVLPMAVALPAAALLLFFVATQADAPSASSTTFLSRAAALALPPVALAAGLVLVSTV